MKKQLFGRNYLHYNDIAIYLLFINLTILTKRNNKFLYRLPYFIREKKQPYLTITKENKV